MELDLYGPMRQLAEASKSSPGEQVFVWRKVLTETWRAGCAAGHIAAAHDRGMEDLIAREEVEAGNGHHERAAAALSHALLEAWPELAKDEMAVDHLAAVVLSAATR